jgi:hypothetical protein
MLVLALANILLAVWRPRLGQKTGNRLVSRELAHGNGILSNEKNYIAPYKEYAAHRSIFGSMSHALRWPREGQGLGEIRAGKPANSPVGATSRRRGYLIRPTPFFIVRWSRARCEERSAMIAVLQAHAAGLWQRSQIRNNVAAGIIVGVVALPLAMAFAIASGVRPEQGIYTSIVFGVLTSLFGGTRVQVSGPTGAFVAVLAIITAQHGIGGKSSSVRWRTFSARPRC